MKTLSIITMLALALPLLSQAEDLSLGYRDQDNEVPVVSLHVNGNLTMIRFTPNRNQVYCGIYRKDLCGLEDKIKYFESTVPTGDCNIVSSSLASCRLNTFSLIEAKVVLTDGTTRVLNQIMGLVEFDELERPNDDQQGGADTVVENVLKMEVWGHRADGLDPLIQGGTEFNLFSISPLRAVKKSLFD
jgi:hypothetical protein